MKKYIHFVHNLRHQGAFKEVFSAQTHKWTVGHESLEPQ